jgi:hypothetical protein
MDFRLFLLRHSELLRPLLCWTIRVLVPAPFTKAIRMFGHAAREELATPIAPATAEGRERFFRQRQQRQQGPSQLPDERFQSASLAYRAPRFRALFRMWQQEGNPAIWAAQSGVLKDALERGEGRVEFVKLTHQYCHLSSLGRRFRAPRRRDRRAPGAAVHGLL